MEEQNVDTPKMKEFTVQQEPEREPDLPEGPSEVADGDMASPQGTDVEEEFRRAMEPELARLKERDAVLYSGLDADRILSQPRFLQLLGAGLSIEEAHAVLNREQIAERMRQQIRADVVRDIEARGLRPAEGAAHPSGVGNAAVDVAGLTREDMQTIRRRVLRGEQIIL